MVPAHKVIRENTGAFVQGFTLLVKLVKAWETEDQEAKE